MKKTNDESRRITRLSSREAQKYLAELKGAKYIEYRQKWSVCGANQVMSNTPLQLNVELTANCNLKCKMCYRGYDMDVRSGALSMEDVKRLASQAADLEIPSIWLSGGEPLIHPSIRAILKVFGDTKPLDFWLVSNGLLLDEEKSRSIVDSGMTWLSVSIDAANPNTYREIRGAELEQVRKNVDGFLNIREKMNSRLPFLRVSFINMPENRGEEAGFIHEWSRKADIIDFQTLANYHDLDSLDSDAIASSDFLCTAPFTLVSVIPNGDIIPCCNGFYSGNSNFNINNISLEEYWNSSYHQAFAQAIKEKKYSSECLKCVKSFIPH